MTLINSFDLSTYNAGQFSLDGFEMHSQHVPHVNKTTNERERAKLEEKHRERENVSCVGFISHIGTRL